MSRLTTTIDCSFRVSVLIVLNPHPELVGEKIPFLCFSLYLLLKLYIYSYIPQLKACMDSFFPVSYMHICI